MFSSYEKYYNQVSEVNLPEPTFKFKMPNVSGTMKSVDYSLKNHFPSTTNVLGNVGSILSILGSVWNFGMSGLSGSARRFK